MELWDFASGSSPDYIYLITSQDVSTGLITDQQFLTYSQIPNTFDLSPSQVVKLINDNKLPLEGILLSCIRTPMVKK